MRARRTIRLAVLAGAVAIGLSIPVTAAAQDVMARAKTLYGAAEYEEALHVLATLADASPSSEASTYRMYCLVALGRRDEARAVADTIVRQDPFYQLSDAEVSPRILTLFNEVRDPLLTDIARQSFEKAKTAFERGDWALAIQEFDRVKNLVDEAPAATVSGKDLRTLAEGFRELARSSLAGADALKPPVANTTRVTPTETRSEPKLFEEPSGGIKPPTPVAAALPEWRPTFFELNQTFAGQIDLVIDETGKVIAVTLVKSVHPRYDDLLLQAARTWTFTPATKDGVPVSYRYSMPVQVLK